MEDREATVTRFEARRLLPSWEFAELDDLRRTIDQGYRLAPGAERRYDQLLDKVRRMKQKEFSGMLAEEYAEQLKDDDSRLEEISDGIEIFTKKEAIEFLVRDYPNFGKILETSDPINWLPEYIPKIREAATGHVEGVFDYLMSEVENPQAFDYKKKIWPITIPSISYIKKGIDSLKFSLEPYAVFTIEVNRTEHEKEFDGWIFTFPSSEKVLCQIIDILDPGFLNMKSPTITLPLVLLRGLSSGDLQPSGCEITKQEETALSYRIVGFDQEVVLPHGLVMFLMELGGEEPLKRLQELGLLSTLTLKILESKKDDDKPMELPVISGKDEEHLRIISDLKLRSSWGGWGEALGMSRQGAKDKLLRFEELGVIKLERLDGEGIRAIITSLGQAYLV